MRFTEQPGTKGGSSDVLKKIQNLFPITSCKLEHNVSPTMQDLFPGGTNIVEARRRNTSTVLL
jgi:hypothetical protein